MVSRFHFSASPYLSIASRVMAATALIAAFRLTPSFTNSSRAVNVSAAAFAFSLLFNWFASFSVMVFIFPPPPIQALTQHQPSGRSPISRAFVAASQRRAEYPPRGFRGR
ncbi:hypothetical protein NEIPOLOT_02224, partial [Neisseria polysaccharea ATCC 43768]